MTQRDPRIDPRPGDVLVISGVAWTVERIRGYVDIRAGSEIRTFAPSDDLDRVGMRAVGADWVAAALAVTP